MYLKLEDGDLNMMNIRNFINFTIRIRIRNETYTNKYFKINRHYNLELFMGWKIATSK